MSEEPKIILENGGVDGDDRPARSNRDQETLPSVSVVIPVHNRAGDLPHAIESAIDQTLPPQEIVIVDDGSSDGTYERALQISHDGIQVRVLRHEENQGASAARNTGWRQASGKLIAFLDSDDRWLPHKLEKQVAALQSDPSIGMVYCGFVALAGSDRQCIYERRAIPTEPWQQFQLELACGNCVGTASVAMVRKTDLERSGGFNAAFPSCQDWELWYRLAKVCRFTSVAEPLVECQQSSIGRISASRDHVLVGHDMMFRLIEQDYGGRLPRLIKSQHCTLKAKRYREFNQPWQAAVRYSQGFILNPSLRPIKSIIRSFARKLIPTESSKGDAHITHPGEGKTRTLPRGWAR